MSAIETGDVLVADDGALFVILRAGIDGSPHRYRLYGPNGAVRPSRTSSFEGHGSRDAFSPCFGGYGTPRYLGHRDDVAALSGVGL